MVLPICLLGEQSITDGPSGLRALSLAGPDSDLVGPAHFAVAGSALHLGMPGEAVRHFETAAKLSRSASLSVGTHPDVHGPAWAAHAHWLLSDDGRDEAARSTLDAAAAGARMANAVLGSVELVLVLPVPGPP